MRALSILAGLALFAAFASLTQFAAAQAQQSRPAIPQAETHTVATLPPLGPHRVFVFDTVFPHAKDERVYLMNGDTGKLKGMIPAANWGNFALDPNGKYNYVSETIWTLGNRGTRQDLISVYDGKTLDLVAEIPIPGRFLIVNKKQDFDTSTDGRYLYVYNMDPASSVIVVDATQKKTVGTIEIPGCGLIFPWGGNGFSSLCADGSLATATFTADGTVKPTLTHTAPFFPADTDPIFEHSPFNKGAGIAYFLSYTGLVYPTRLGEKPEIQAPWSIQQAAGMARATTNPQEVAWRPGGWQLAALHASDGQIYVLMHEGKFWTHKQSGTEIWVLDANARKLLRRIKLKEPVTSIAVSQDANPQLYTLTEDATFAVLDPKTGQVLHEFKKLGDSPQVMTVQGD